MKIAPREYRFDDVIVRKERDRELWTVTRGGESAGLAPSQMRWLVRLLRDGKLEADEIDRVESSKGAAKKLIHSLRRDLGLEDTRKRSDRSYDNRYINFDKGFYYWIYENLKIAADLKVLIFPLKFIFRTSEPEFRKLIENPEEELAINLRERLDVYAEPSAMQSADFAATHHCGVRIEIGDRRDKRQQCTFRINFSRFDGEFYGNTEPFALALDAEFPARFFQIAVIEIHKLIRAAYTNLILELKSSGAKEAGDAIGDGVLVNDFRFAPLEPKAGFVEREVKLQSRESSCVETLVAEFAASGRRCLVLWGGVGAGKSTAANEIGRRLEDDFGFKCFWSSAKNRPAYYLDSLFDDIFDQLPRVIKPPKGGDWTTNENAKNNLSPETINRLLRSETKQCLLVIDNFESIASAYQAACLEWIRSEQCPCNILITSHDRIEGATNYPLGDMTTDEAVELVARLKEISPNVELAPERIVAEVETTNPLILETAVEYLQVGGTFADFYQREFSGARESGDVSNRFKQFYGSLNPDALQILDYLVLFPTATNRENLIEMTGFENRLGEFQVAIENLMSKNLVSVEREQIVIGENARQLRKKVIELEATREKSSPASKTKRKRATKSAAKGANKAK